MKKICKKCSAEKMLADFSPDKRNSDGRYSTCKTCCAERAAKKRAEDPSKSKEACSKWREKNHDRLLESRKQSYALNPEHYRKRSSLSYWSNVEKNRERMARTARAKRSDRRDYEQKRRDENPDLNRAKVARRRALRISAPGLGFTKDDVSMLISEQGNKCGGCFESLTSAYHVDHVIPLSRGGANDISNIQMLCVTCNTSKGAKHPLEFFKRMGSFDA